MLKEVTLSTDRMRFFFLFHYVSFPVLLHWVVFLLQCFVGEELWMLLSFEAYSVFHLRYVYIVLCCCCLDGFFCVFFCPAENWTLGVPSKHCTPELYS